MQGAARHPLFIVVTLLFGLTFLAGQAAAAWELPVYPGAKLEIISPAIAVRLLS